jgi:hypothetical protein
MASLGSGKPMDLATAAKLVRMTSQMARKAAEKDMGEESGKRSNMPNRVRPTKQHSKHPKPRIAVTRKVQRIRKVSRFQKLRSILVLS